MTQTPQTAPSLADGDTDLHPVQISMKGLGKAEVLLHGVDIAPDLTGFYLSAPSPTSPPELVVVLGPRLSSGTTYDGFARVLVGHEPDPGPAAAAFLDAIDPAALEQAALNRDDLDPGPGGLTKAMLVQLSEWAQGR